MSDHVNVPWTAYVTEEGDPWAAFVSGHVDIRTIAGAAVDEIPKAFADYGEEIVEDVQGLIDDSCGAVLTQFWLAPAEEEEGMFVFAGEGERGAFPVTGMRFM